MNSLKIFNCYKNRKDKYIEYIHNIKTKMVVDIYSVVNTTMIKNPFNHEFPLKFLLEDFKKENKYILFIKSCFVFYIKQFYYLVTYLISILVFKFFYRKKKIDLKNNIILDLFFNVNTIIKNKKFNEKYFLNLYKVLDKYKQKYIFLPRLNDVSKNPFKLIKFLKIINNDDRNFLFEFELITFKDIYLLLLMICIYPFKTLRLLQKELKDEDILFNNELIKDISRTNLSVFTRYLFGKNLSKLKDIEKIYSWSEFQAIERSFNYGIRTNNFNIELFGCQFFQNYDTYFNSSVDDIDNIQKTAYHTVLVNGKYNILNRKNVNYKEGVSLRYGDLFKFKIEPENKYILVLGSYLINDTKYMLECVQDFNNIIFKSHPVVGVDNFNLTSKNIKLVDNNIYELFNNSNIIISTASGTLIEAVSSGLSAIIIASNDNLTANPFINYGKGKIWDIVFSKNDVISVYNRLVKFRNNNIDEINEIALWYKENFFIEPSEENIKKTFEIGRD